MVLSMPPIPPPVRATLYGTTLSTQVPSTYGPDRTPLHRPNLSRTVGTVGEPELSPMSKVPPTPKDVEVDPALFTAHRGRSHTARKTFLWEAI